MCEPVSIGVGLAVLASAATIAQQQEASKTQNAYEKLLYGQRKDAALQDMASLRTREFQEREKAAQDIRRVTSQARQATATAKLSALESGTSGQSVNALLSAFERGELANVGIVQSNLAATSAQLRDQQRAIGRVQGPSIAVGPLDTPLGITASTLQVGAAGYGAYSAAKPATPPVSLAGTPNE